MTSARNVRLPHHPCRHPPGKKRITRGLPGHEQSVNKRQRLRRRRRRELPRRSQGGVDSEALKGLEAASARGRPGAAAAGEQNTSTAGDTTSKSQSRASGDRITDSGVGKKLRGGGRVDGGRRAAARLWRWLVEQERGIE
jgi:hypothetical protein